MKQALADALEHRGYTALTPVQEAVTDPALANADLLVSAQTGSGKTVGFGLAIAPTLLADAESFAKAASPLALIIAPTRELALQVQRELSWLYAKAGAVVTSCVGGMDMRDERRALGRGAHIVVATPGRLRDHIMRGSIDMSGLRAVVLDEADEMLDLGFREDLEFILGEAPETRRTLMFSATVPRGIANLAKSYQNDAVRVTTTAEKSQHADIEYLAMNVAPRDSENAIINVLRFYEAPNALVFCNTRATVNRLTARLSNRGFSVVSLSGELSQTERTHALQAMRDGRARVCVATDVAARGIDLPNLDLVVHAELPSNHETMLHRSGRTGRAGRKGVSALIVPPQFRRKAERILQGAKVTPTWGEAPSADAIRRRDEDRMLADPAWHEPVAKADRGLVEKLVGQFSAEQIAAAYVRLNGSRQSAPEELAPAGGGQKAPSQRGTFGPSVWFSITGGRKENAEPRRLLPMLCKAGNLTNDDIGAIRVQQDQSYFEIKLSSVEGFLDALGDDMVVEAGAKVTKLDTPPTIVTEQRRGSPPKPQDRKPKGRRSGAAAPIDWDDAPAPRKKKPKPGAPGSKPKFPREPKPERPEGVVTPLKKRKTQDGKPKLVTPVGKPNSKKNKARRAGLQAQDMKGGSAVPKRGRKKP
ncbi:DEAD/DEAH box helicase [Aliiroseovarius sp. YM-037]|uniref:DEAD/DEAH box helicase n=1 Tax=Aliiroseovarius sp. YM-037 TaxID=3341728 RepID=UPI003A808CDA